MAAPKAPPHRSTSLFAIPPRGLDSASPPHINIEAPVLLRFLDQVLLCLFPLSFVVICSSIFHFLLSLISVSSRLGASPVLHSIARTSRPVLAACFNALPFVHPRELEFATPSGVNFISLTNLCFAFFATRILCWFNAKFAAKPRHRWRNF